MIEEPFAFGESAFSVSSPCVLTIPFGMKDAYIEAGWEASTFRAGIRNTIEETDQTPVIKFADDAVKTLCVTYWDVNGDGELSEAEAASLVDMGSIFQRNSNITSFEELKFFKGLTSIKAYEFQRCGNLTSITIPEGIESIGNNAFYLCYSLTTVTLPEGLTDIGYNAFSDCRGLTSIMIPKSVSSIGSGAFYRCSALTSIIIPKDVTFINTSAFCNCSNLASVISMIEEPFAFRSSAFKNISTE